MAATIKLDRFEILWFCEGFVGKSHLRWSGYERMVNDIWPQLNDDEREAIYTYTKRDLSWHWEGNYVDDTAYEYWKQMLARYNPANQYKVTLKHGRKKEVVDAYKWNDKYYVGWSRYCDPAYIVSIEQKPYKKCRNSYCTSCDNCERFCNWNKGDELLDNIGHDCDKCDYIIEVTPKEHGNK